MRIAIIRLSSLGDIITTMAFLELLRAQIKHCHITWIVDSNFSGIIANSPLIDEVCALPLRKSKKNKKMILEVFQAIKKLDRFDFVLDFQGLIKSAFIGFLLKKTHFVGFSKNGCREKLASIFYNKRAEIPYESHILKRHFCILKTAFDLKMDFDLHLLNKRDLAFGCSNPAKNKIDNLIQQKTLAILFILESSKIQKQYPSTRFLELAKLIKKNIINAKIYVIWDREESIARGLCDKDNIFYLLPHLDFDEIIALLKKMDLVVGGDTGISHLAWALKIPSITLYGNTPIDRFRLDGKLHKSLCKIKHEKIDKNDFSIQNIDPSEIFSVMKEMLGIM